MICSSINSLTNFNYINCANEIKKILYCLTYLFFIYNIIETSISIKYLTFINSKLITILIFQFNCRSLLIIKTLISEKKINLIVTKREVFCDEKFFNSRIFLRNVFNFCFQTRCCSKTFNFSNCRC